MEVDLVIRLTYGYSNLYWSVEEVPDDATYDLYTREVLFRTNVNRGITISEQNGYGDHMIRLKSIYGDLYSNIVTPFPVA